MANAIPLLEGTEASGGYLVEDAVGPMLVNAIARESAVFELSTKQTINTNKERFPIYAGRPTVTVVGEGAAKTATGAEYSELAVNIKKFATIVMYTDELLEDARIDPTVLVNTDVAAAFADTYDAHALGQTSAGPITGTFDSELTETTQTVEFGTGGDALAKAISAAMEKVESNGYDPNGVILARDARAHMRDARQTVETAMPVYSAGYTTPVSDIYGIPLRYSSNLETIGGTAAASRCVGVVGDFRHAYFVIRKAMTMSASTQATVDVGGTLHHLWQQNKTAILWESRAGFVAHDLNKTFCAILNAS